MANPDGKDPHPLAGTIRLPDHVEEVAEPKLTKAQKSSTLPIPEDVLNALREKQGAATPFPGGLPSPKPAGREAEAAEKFQQLVQAAPRAESGPREDLTATLALPDANPAPVDPNTSDPMVAQLQALASQEAGDVSLEGTMAVHGQPTEMDSPFALASPEPAPSPAPIPGAPWSAVESPPMATTFDGERTESTPLGETDGDRSERDEARRQYQERLEAQRAEVKRQAEAQAQERARLAAEEAAKAKEADAQRLEEERLKAQRLEEERLEAQRLAAEARRKEEAEAFQRQQEAAAAAEARRKEARRDEQARRAAALRKGMYGGFGPKGD